jgi:hypothetical protein
MKKTLLAINIIFLLSPCAQKEKVDLLIYNATIYTVDSSFTTAEAMEGYWLSVKQVSYRKNMMLKKKRMRRANSFTRDL